MLLALADTLLGGGGVLLESRVLTSFGLDFSSVLAGQGRVDSYQGTNISVPTFRQEMNDCRG